MTESVRVKIERIEEYLRILREIEGSCMENFLKDPIFRGALLHYLYMVADSSISLAEMIIKDKSLRTPQSYSDSIEILGEAEIIPPSFAYEFARIAGLRNFLAHDYEKIDPVRICNETLKMLKDVETYIEFIKKHYSL